jgi:hypothetical protein
LGGGDHGSKEGLRCHQWFHDSLGWRMERQFRGISEVRFDLSHLSAVYRANVVAPSGVTDLKPLKLLRR